ncbi:hypothetical protein [Kitasatospora cineracea]|uniref:hypothetical protein n=1 Tax=Kitasatospora cineracea TaxID=88074 RepID=UPI001ABF5C52|nr:hypothetical protein [Kitasatospora cineracea]
MKITVIADEPTEGFLDDLRALLAKHAAHVEVDTAWNPDRISRYYLALPPRSQRILEEAVARGGYVSADDLRGDDPDASLKGHSGGLTRILNLGIRKGWWPDGIEPPVQAHGPGFGKVVGYGIRTEQLDLFRDTVLTLPTQRLNFLAEEIAHRDDPWDDELVRDALTIFKLAIDLDGARVLLRHLVETGLLAKNAAGFYRRTTDTADQD